MADQVRGQLAARIRPPCLYDECKRRDIVRDALRFRAFTSALTLEMTVQ